MKTHVVMLLDESSSMKNYQKVVVSTFNEYVATLKKDTKQCWLSLFKFSGNTVRSNIGFNEPFLKTVFENRKVKETYDLTETQYNPYGWTPLYDAIGALIKRTKERLPKEAKVLFVVHTDGQENTSKKYNQESIRRMIRKCEKKRGWTFVYLGEGAEAWNAGYDFGIDNVANFSSSLRGAAMHKMASATSCFAASADVGGAAGATKTFYADAKLTADDIDPEDQGTYSSVVTNSDNEASKTDG